ncbi:hypothetical protein [Embleya sp. NPDC050493]|uniref:hypothetical protein n=1 Tax=Embleya sp. NPDC050493 TaxID=3363989 RepID=UPI0037A8CF86
MESTPEQLVRQAARNALAIGDAAQRAKAITAFMDAIKAVSPELKATRRKDVALLRENHSYRKVGELIGVSHTRVQQIERSE